MKKVYLSLLLCMLSLATFATTWYSTPAGGTASVVTNWWSTTGGTGTQPADFSSAADIWVVQSTMTLGSGTTWTLGGSLSLTSGSLVGALNTINIGGNLSLSGSAFMNSTSGAINYYVNGDFSMTGSSYITNSPSFSYVYLSNTSSTLASPQHVTLTAGALGNWTYLVINAGCTAQLMANAVWTASGYSTTVNGTLDCQNFSFTGASPFILSSGATLYTANAAGVNGAITTTGAVTHTPGASYAFNGTAAQVTGTQMPATMAAPGSIIINNPAGVTLSQTTVSTGSLSFLNGVLNTGSNTLTLPGAAAAVTGAGTGKYVNGTLLKTITGVSTVNYEIGDITYAPVQLTLSAAGTAGAIGVKSTSGTHPQMSSSGFITSQYANHYWSVTNSGAAGPATVTLKATYNLADIIGGSNSTFVNQKYAGGIWLSAPQTTTNNTSVPYSSTINTATPLGSLAGDYIFGVPGPAVFTTPTSLAFGLIGNGTSSPSQSFTMTGSTLTSGGTVTITPPANFQVSLNNVTWFSTPVPYTYTGVSFTSIPVYVRFQPVASVAYTGTVTITGGGLATATNVAVTGTGAITCSGTPTPGTAAISPVSGGAPINFTLSLSGTTVAGGLTYQWQSAPSATGPFTNISGATTAPFTFSGLTVNTYYQAIVTCPTFPGATSNTVMATYMPPTPVCTPLPGANVSWGSPTSYSFGVSGFTMPSSSGPSLSDPNIYANLSSTSSTNSYLSRLGTIAPIILYKGNTFPSSVTWQSTSTAEYAQVWVDFNDDGVFAASEEVTPVFGTGYALTTVNPVNFNISIPLSAPSGIHLMRMRSAWESGGTGIGSFPPHMDPCLFKYGSVNPSYFSGSAVDYYVDIQTAPACTGTPTAGTISPSISNGCTPYTSTLNLSGASASSGIAFQWFSSTDNITYNPISGATSNTYVANVTSSIYYKAQLTCTATTFSATTPAAFLNLPSLSYATIPFSEGFENSWISVCNTADVPNNFWRNTPATGNNSWRREDDAPTVNTAVWTSPTSYAYSPGGSNAGGTSSSHSARFHQGFTSSGVQGKMDLYVNLPAGNKQISYDYITGSSTVGTNNSIQLQVSTDGGATFTNIGTGHNGPVGWTTLTETTTIASPTAILRWVTTSDFGSFDIGLDNVSVFVLAPCTAPAAQPTALTFTPSLFNLSGSFSAPTPTADKYVVVMTTTNVAPAAPVNGTNYSVGSTALGGVVVSNTNATTFTATGLTPGTQYWFWIYGYNYLCIGGPLYTASAPLAGNAFTNTCNLSGVRTVGPTGTYPTLTAAMTAVMNNGLGGPLALELQTTYDGTGETYPIVISNPPCGSATNTLTIRPQGTMTITYGAGTQPFLDLNGANNVIIDGRVGSTGTTKALTISSTNVGAQSIRFINDASYNTVKYCTIKSINTSTTQGTVFFFTTTGLTGNDYNTIDNCDLLDGATTPVNAIYSTGTTGKENDHNTVSNCNIANYFSASSATNGIFLTTANTDWTITNNRFYQTAARTYTTGTTHRAIQISNTAGNNFTITNNTIGYASSTGTGVYTLGGTVATNFYGITLSVGAAVPSSVQGNTISGINLTTTSTTSTTGGALCGISITNGSANIGTITPNVIGAATGNGALTATVNTSTGGTVVGINASSASPNTVNIQNNTIGSITVINGSATLGGGIQGIQVSSNASFNVSNNTIGSTTTANSLYLSTVSTGTQILYGINSAITSGGIVAPIISNNAIANLTALGTATGSLAAGILHTGTGSPTISGNTIRNISSASANTAFTAQPSISGIAYTGGTGTPLISGNTINAISNTNTGTVIVHVNGIGISSAVNPIITHNKIYDLRNASTYNTTVTTPATANGILLASATTSATIDNNMISLGNGQTTNTSFTGIMNSASTVATRIYYNTVNIEGTVTAGIMNTAAFNRGNYNTTAITTTVDVRNNIFNNTRTGGTGAHYAIANGVGVATSSATGWGTNASNYNLLNASVAANVGYWSGAKTFAAWKTASASDANSNTASAITFTNTVNGDLHVNMGVTANNIESHGTAISGFGTDFDNENRPGPTAVNGGGYAPDLGADEFDGVAISNLPPTITYTTLTNSCGTADRIVTVSIVDANVIPTTGALQPMIYFKKGVAGTWYSTQGTLSSGTGTNGVWSFTISSTLMGGLAIGDQVFYYVIAQDGASNIISNPAAGLVATDVNTVTTPPTTPNSYNVLLSVGGTIAVGSASAAPYNTLTSAVNAYNTGCLSGPVVFSLTDATYAAAETFPITVQLNSFASATNTLTIRPAAGVAVNINGAAASTAIFKFLNARYVTLDGVNAGGSSLTMNNNNTGASSNVWFASTAGSGNNFVAVKNTTISGGVGASTSSWGFLSSLDGGSSNTTAGPDNDNITIQNNNVTKVGYGVYAFGTAFNSTGGLDNWLITGNTFGPAVYNTATNIGYNGMYLGSMINPTITSNTVQNVGSTSLSSQVVGIYMTGNVSGANISQNTIRNITSVPCTSGTGANFGIGLGSNNIVLNCSITGNTITGISNNYPYTGGCGRACGIMLYTSSGVSNTLIANNMISDVWATAYGFGSPTVTYGSVGIDIQGTSGGVKIYYNSVNMNSSIVGYNGPTISACLLLNNSTGSNLDIRNNNFVNTFDNTTTTTEKNYAIASFVSSGNISNIDYNNYSVSGSNVLGLIGGVDRTTLPAMQSAFGGNTHSINVAPLFLTPTDLHLLVNGANVPLIAGIPVSVTTDKDGTTRSNTTPVIGAHEVYIPPCGVVAPGLAVAANPNLCVSGSTTINLVGSTAGFGLNYQWKSSTDSVNWSNIAGATSVSYTIAPAITTTTYYRAVLTCTLPGGTKDSTTAKVRVNALPTISVTPDGGAYCSGSTLTMGASGALSYTWAPSTGLSSANASVVTTSVTGTTVYTVTGTDIYGCVNTHVSTVTVTATPLSPTITTSSSPVICSGGSVMLTASTPPPGSVTVSSGSVNLPIPDGSTTGVFSGVNVSTVPAGATITSVNVNFNITHTWDADLRINFTAPNGSTINFVNGAGSSGDNFTNTTVSSLGGLSFATGTAPFTGTYAAQAGTGDIGAAGYAVNTTNFASLFSVPNGTWTFSARDVTGSDAGTINSWSMTINYTLPPATFSWTPAINLFNDAALTTPYTGGTTASVYAAPTANSVTTNSTYTAVASNAGCTSTSNVVVTVNPLPAAITGANNVCVGSTTTLGNTTTGGTWSSASPNVTVVAATGAVTGITAGTANITYTLGTSCNRIFQITVNPLPLPITGNADVCIAATNTLTSATLGGTWQSSDPATATISNLGALTGVIAGSSTISYTLSTGCRTTVIATVNVLPSVIVSPATSATICMGGNATFTASVPLTGVQVLTQNFNSTLPPTWVVTNLNSGPATPASYWQIVPTNTNSNAGDGSSMLQASGLDGAGNEVHTIVTSPSFSTIGYASANLTFNQTVVSDGSDPIIKVEYSVNNGPWNTLADYIALGNVNTGGTWNAGTPEANISLPAAAIGQSNVKIRWNYQASSVYWAIDNVNVSAVPPAASYAWTGAAGLSCAACGTTTITPTAVGANNYSVTATTSHNCMTTVPVMVSVNAMPAAINGANVVCEQSTITMTNTATGGTWTSSNATTASVNASTGVVTGNNAGVATITYTLNGGCFVTKDVTVNQTPAAFTGGNTTICAGLTTTFNESVTGGTWSSSTISVATVNNAGLVTGVAQGTADINYTMSTGCKTMVTVTVNPTPSAISGTRAVCENATTMLGNSLNGGTWSSSSPANATVDPTSGEVTGVLAGTTTITYEMATGCKNMADVTVNTTPAAITGTPIVCENYTTTLADATSVGIWTSNNMTVATVNGIGVVSGNTAGVATISYMLITGCYATSDVTVNATPAAITGTLSVCENGTTILANTMNGGTWTSTTPTVATIDAASGEVTGIASGITSITYSMATGCYANAFVTVNPSPAVIDGNTQVCEGLTTTLTNTVAGGSWTSSDASTASIDAVSGEMTGGVAGNATITYTLPAGCQSMTDVTVNPSPATITGAFTICRGTTTILDNAVTGGSWTSNNAAVASVDAVTGEVTGVAGGSTTITYTLPAGCKTTTGMAVNFVSEVYTVTGTGSYCDGGNGLEVGLSGSDMNSVYQLYNGAALVGSQVAGSGSAISFGVQTTAAIYTVVANPDNGCATAMSGDATITINPLPGIYDVAGTGNYCSATGGHVTLQGSDNDADISYVLYQNGLPAGTLTGTGAALDFGAFTTAGTFTVQATNTATSCTQAMNLAAVLTITPTVVPAVSISQNIGSLICANTAVTFTASPVNGGSTPVYTWKVNGTTVSSTSNTYSYTPVNGDVVKTVLHSNAACASPDSAVNSVTMNITPRVMPSITIDAAPGNNVCKGTAVTYELSAVHTGTAPVYTWVVNGNEVSNATTYTYVPQDNDVVYAVLNSNADCRLDTAVYSNNELMTVDSGLIPIVNIKVLNGTYLNVGQVDSFVAQVSNAGTAPTYKWFVNGTAIPGATSTLFSSNTLRNNDSVTVQVINNGPCGFSTFNSVIIKVKTTGIATVATAQSDLRLIPNPNNGAFVVNGTLGNTTDELVNFEVTDMLGQVVYKGQSMSKAGNVNEQIKIGNTLANGMYMLNVKTATDSKVFHFVLKQ